MLSRVNVLMKKLRTPIQAAKLRERTDLTPEIIRSNQTRWTAKFKMIERYLKLYPFLDYRDVELEEVLLNNAQHQEVEAFLPLFQRLHSITTELQRKDITLSEVRALFNDVLDDYPYAGRWLSPDGALVVCRDLEKGVVKVLTGAESDLSLEEKEALIPFRNTVEIPEDLEDDINLTYAQKVIQRTKSRKVSSRYIDLGSIPPTSCEVERLFSIARHVYSEDRRGLLPVNLEGSLFLKVNRQYWDKSLVSRAIKN